MEVVMTEVVIMEVDQGTPPSPPEVVMEVDQGTPQDKDQATCKVFTISICRLNLVYVCF